MNSVLSGNAEISLLILKEATLCSDCACKQGLILYFNSIGPTALRHIKGLFSIRVADSAEQPQPFRQDIHSFFLLFFLLHSPLNKTTKREPPHSRPAAVILGMWAHRKVDDESFFFPADTFSSVNSLLIPLDN